MLKSSNMKYKMKPEQKDYLKNSDFSFSRDQNKCKSKDIETQISSKRSRTESTMRDDYILREPLEKQDSKATRRLTRAKVYGEVTQPGGSSSPPSLHLKSSKVPGESRPEEHYVVTQARNDSIRLLVPFTLRNKCGPSRFVISSSKSSVSAVPGHLGRPAMSEERLTYWMCHYRLYDCRHCGILYKDQNLYYLHMQAHTKWDPFWCDCGHLSLANGYSFNSHLYLHPHKFRPQDSRPVPKFRVIAGYLGTPPLPAARRLDWWMCESLYECLPCKILFKNYHVYDLHVAAHLSIDEPFLCKCKKDFFTSYFFNVHLYVAEHQ